MNRNALETPASRRCASNGAASVKKPLRPMNRLDSKAPATVRREGPYRAIRRGAARAPSRYPRALAVFIAPARV
jgi:hypothetical protein